MDNRPSPLSIDLVVLLAGIAAVLGSGYPLPSLLQDFLRAIGTALVAAGLVSFLIRRFSHEERLPEIEIVTHRRGTIESDYSRRNLTTGNLDICGISLTGALTDFSRDERLIKRVLLEGVTVRLSFLSPLSSYVEQRSREDGVSPSELQKTLRHSVRISKEIFDRIVALREQAIQTNTLRGDREGNLEIRTFDACPYFTIYRTDDTILWHTR